MTAKKREALAVLSRLRKTGIDIKNYDAVLVALNRETNHYRAVISEMERKLRERPAPGGRMRLDMVRCDECELGEWLRYINDHSRIRLNSVTQDGDLFTLFVEVPLDG